MINDKKVLYSGMQATGNLTLGNYLGALKNWVSLNEEYECFFGVMDLHSITVRQELISGNVPGTWLRFILQQDLTL